MRERALAATVGEGREFAQTRLSFLGACIVFPALTNVLAYEKIRQPTIIVQVRIRPPAPAAGRAAQLAAEITPSTLSLALRSFTRRATWSDSCTGDARRLGAARRRQRAHAACGACHGEDA